MHPESWPNLASAFRIRRVIRARHERICWCFADCATYSGEGSDFSILKSPNFYFTPIAILRKGSPRHARDTFPSRMTFALMPICTIFAAAYGNLQMSSRECGSYGEVVFFLWALLTEYAAQVSCAGNLYATKQLQRLNKCLCHPNQFYPRTIALPCCEVEICGIAI